VLARFLLPYCPVGIYRTKGAIFVKKRMSKWIAVLAVVAAQHVSAGLVITDTVTVGSQQWAQVGLFTDNSWNTINAQCPGGVCLSTGEINGWDLDDWRWA
jgi:hypothetical protein